MAYIVNKEQLSHQVASGIECEKFNMEVGSQKHQHTWLFKYIFPKAFS